MEFSNQIVINLLDLSYIAQNESLFSLVNRDHPYITSAHFWTFLDTTTHPTSAKIVLDVT